MYGVDRPQSQDLVSDLDIEVLEIRHVNGDSIRAFLTVQIGPITIHNCRVVKQTGQDAWFALPAEKSVRDGKWRPVLEIADRALLARVREAVLDAWRGSVG